MILSLLIFFILLIILYLLSRRIIKNLYLFFFLLTNNKNTSLNLLSFLLLPGTVIHELSHMLIAELLFVRTGEFSFRPEIEESQVKVGRLKIASTDPIRRTVIGLAPLIVGLAIIGSLCNFYLFPKFFSFPPLRESLSSHSRSVFGLGLLPQFLILFSVFYLLFFISITMFSSKKDLETTIFPAILLAIIAIVFWLAGFKLTFPKYFLDALGNLFATLNKALIFICLLDFVGLLGIKFLQRLFFLLG